MSASLAQKLASFCFGLIALAMMVGSGTASQETDLANRQKPPNTERKLRIANPQSMRPDSTVAITAIKNLNDEHWSRDLEIEAKNNFQKPIYYLQVVLTLPEIVSTELDGIPRTYALPLTYGRPDLWKLENLATSEDVPINPGESIGLKLPEHYWKALESHLARRNIPASSIKTIQLTIRTISFGDGTGMKNGRMVGAKQRSNNELTQQKTWTGMLKETEIINSTRNRRERDPSLYPLADTCGPSGISPRCAMYEEIHDTCPYNSGPCERIYYSGYSNNPNATCIGYIKYGYFECTPGDPMSTCSLDDSYDCDEWVESGQCSNIPNYRWCVDPEQANQGYTWHASTCTCIPLAVDVVFLSVVKDIIPI